MKTICKVVGLLAMVGLISACAGSLDSIKYAGWNDKEIQANACCCEKTKIQEVIKFDFDSSVVKKDQQPTINKVAKLMKEYPGTVLLIGAYASVEGAGDYNQPLSQDRANSVKDALIKAGVSPDQIQNAIGKGETKLFGDLLDLNRRAIIISME